FAAGVLRGDRGVDTSPQVERDGHIAVGIEQLSRKRRGPCTEFLAPRERKIRTVFVSVRCLQRKCVFFCWFPHNVNYSSQRIGSVKMRGSAAGGFNAGNRLTRDSIPVHPAAKGIVQRNSVSQNERPARAACPKPAQRDSLRSGIRSPAGSTTKQAESGNLAEDVIHSKGGCRSDVIVR